MILTKSKNYTITNLSMDRLDDFIKFISYAYPFLSSVDNLSEKFKSFFLNNPLIENKSKPPILVAYNINDKIVGHVLGCPIELFIGEKRILVYYAYAFYVQKEYRGLCIGMDLSASFARTYNWITVGVSDISKKINLNVGSIVGQLYKFFWFRDLFVCAKVLMNQNSKGEINNGGELHSNIKFPSAIKAQGCSFNLIDSKGLLKWEDCFWDNKTIKFNRSNEFIKWWFLEEFSHKYYFYISDNLETKSYFVVRKSLWRGLPFLEVVDYRSLSNDSKSFNSILSAAKVLVKKLSLDGIIVYSSHRFFDGELRKNFFIRNKKPEIIMTNVEFDADKDAINNRNYIIATKTDELIGLIGSYA